MSSIKQIQDLEKNAYSLAERLSKYHDLLKEKNIQIPEHLLEAERDLNLSSLTEPQSPGSSTPNPLSPLLSSPSKLKINPGLLELPGKESETLSAPPSPSVLQQQQYLLKTPEFTIAAQSRRSSFSSISQGPVHDYSAVMNLFAKYNRGAVRVPVSHRNAQAYDRQELKLPDFIDLKTVKEGMPSKEAALEMANNYWATYHHWISPIHSWSVFMEKLKNVYDHSDETLLTDPWAPIVFTVFALGNRESSEERSDKFLFISQVLVRPSVTQQSFPSIMWTMACMMFALYLAETNRLALAKAALGVTWNLAYEQGLTTPHNSFQQHLWWNMFALDRLIALRMGRKPVIPNPYRPKLSINDEKLVGNDQTVPLMYTSIMIHFIQLVDVAGQTLHSQTVLSKAALATFNSHFETFWSIFPDSILNGDLDTPLEGKDLGVLILLKYLQYVLLRLNLSPSASTSQFEETLENLHVGAKNVDKFYKRFKKNVEVVLGKDSTPTADRIEDKYHKELANHSFEIMGTHTWQALVILLSHQDFDRADFLLDVLAVQASTRPSLARYGLFLEGFIEFLERKWADDPEFKPTDDLDVMAIMSTDLQSMEMHAWIWPNRDPPLQDFGVESADEDLTATAVTAAEASKAIEDQVLFDIEASWDQWPELKAKLAGLAQQRATHKTQPISQPKESSVKQEEDACDVSEADSAGTSAPASAPAPTLTVTPAPGPDTKGFDTKTASRMSLSHIM